MSVRDMKKLEEMAEEELVELRQKFDDMINLLSKLEGNGDMLYNHVSSDSCCARNDLHVIARLVNHQLAKVRR